MKKKLDEAKGLWAEYMHAILWSYHTLSHSTTLGTPFKMVYGADAMIPIDINTPTWGRQAFDESVNSEGLNISTD